MVRPIDLQDALSKTQAVVKVTEMQRTAPENEQRTALILSDQKNKDDQKKPIPAQHSDEVILHKDKPEQDDSHGSSEKETEENIEKEQDPTLEDDHDDRVDGEPLPPPSLDITV
jgi:hypothetical protein